MKAEDLSNENLAVILRSLCVTGICPSRDEKEYLYEAADRLEQVDEMAIQALSQEPICDRDCEHCTWTECPIEPCDDAISRAYIEPIIEELENICVNADEYILNLLADIKNAPPVTQKSGKWIAHADGIWIQYYECSECGRGHNTHSDYCPNCGAYMVEPQESEEQTE